MSVGITYTGADGKVTSFNSDSAASAVSRLNAIPGYTATPMDNVASSLAGAWKKRSARKAEGSSNNTPTLLQSGLKKMNIVTNVFARDGHTFIEKQNGYRTADGNFIPVGGPLQTCINVEIDGCTRNNL